MPQEAAPTVMPTVTSAPELENVKLVKREPTSTTEPVFPLALLDSTPTNSHHHAAAATKPAQAAVTELLLTALSVPPTTSSTRPLVSHNVPPTNTPWPPTVTTVTQPVDPVRTATPVSLVPDNSFSSKENANKHAPTEPTLTKTNNALLATEDVKLVSDH